MVDGDGGGEHVHVWFVFKTTRAASSKPARTAATRAPRRRGTAAGAAVPRSSSSSRRVGVAWLAVLATRPLVPLE